MRNALSYHRRADPVDLRETARLCKAELRAWWPRTVLGIGFGAKTVDGRIVDGQLAVRVYVRAKRPRQELSPTEVVPPSVNGFPTDVISLGDLKAQTRPTLCGVSIGHPDVTAGTLGCLVRRDASPYILSNNHVLANCNQAGEGDPILEPALMDGGDPDHPIARLAEFEPLRFGGPVNRFDAAIALLLEPGSVYPEIESIGKVASPVMEPLLYQSVRKRGRTTLHTVGAILDISADVRVRYGKEFAFFEDQIAISGVGGAFSDSGDSGALVVDAVTRRPVALLFGGGQNTTLASPIQPVLDRFGVEIV